MMERLAEELELPAQGIPAYQTQTFGGDLQGMLAIGSLGVASVTADVPQAEGTVIEGIPNTAHMILRSEDTESFVCYRDSFSIALMPYYSYYFNGPVYWSFTIDFNYVESIKPKYLILECVERYLSPALECNASVLEGK